MAEQLNRGTMKKVYVAHPYGGKDENREKVENIIKELIKANPDTLYISPIHALGFIYFDYSYLEGMSYCFELLLMCDELLLCEGWEKSRGCNLERAFAITHNIPITYYKEGEINV